MTFPLHIGFTGTQEGMTAAQAHVVWQIIGWRRDFYVHHGDCIGADAHFDTIARMCPGLLGVVLHPCTITSKRAFCQPRYPYDVVRDVKPPLDRNADIVEESHALLATPKQRVEEQRSGTWSTIRRARRKNIPIVIVHPDGGTWWEGPPWPGP